MSARNKDRQQSYGGSYFKLGTNNVICDRTGFKIKATQSSREWNNSVVRDQSFEERQPMDFLRGLPDHQAPKVSRPGTSDRFLTPGEVKPSDL